MSSRKWKGIMAAIMTIITALLLDTVVKWLVSSLRVLKGPIGLCSPTPTPPRHSWGLALTAVLGVWRVKTKKLHPEECKLLSVAPFPLYWTLLIPLYWTLLGGLCVSDAYICFFWFFWFHVSWADWPLKERDASSTPVNTITYRCYSWSRTHHT